MDLTPSEIEAGLTVFVILLGVVVARYAPRWKPLITVLDKLIVRKNKDDVKKK